MKMSSRLFWIFALIALNVGYPRFVNGGVPSFDDMEELMGFVDYMVAEIQGLEPKSEDDIGTVMTSLDEVHNQLTKLTSAVTSGFDTVTKMLKKLPNEILSNDIKRHLHELNVKINVLWKYFRSVRNQVDQYPKDDIQDFLHSCTSPEPGLLSSMLGEMQHIFVVGEDGHFIANLFDVLVSNQEASLPEDTCGTDSSLQWKIYLLYNTGMTAQLRGLLMKLWCYKLREAYDGKSYPAAVNQVMKIAVQRTEDLINVTKSAMERASQELRVCDPPEHKRDETFTELVGYIQLMVTKEDEASESRHCDMTCGTLSSYDYFNGESDKQDWHPKPCYGKVTDCEWIGESTLCELKPEENRRYAWVKGEMNNYGPVGSCSGNEYRVKQTSWQFYFCDVCMCACHAQHYLSPATSSISFRPQLSDIANNKVVTGIRFVRDGKMIHAEIQQGTLGPRGSVDGGSLEWIPREKIVYQVEGKNGKWYKVDGNDKIELSMDVDYETLMINYGGVFLDNIQLAKDHFVTGFRFACIDWEECQAIQINVHSTKGDFNAGKLEPDENDEESGWMNWRNMKGKTEAYKHDRKYYPLKKPDNPTKAALNVPLAGANTLMVFEHSNLHNDAGQSTVPFFDTQPCVSQLTALSGIGMHFKGAEGFGGFLAPSVFTYDVSKQLNPKATEEQMKSFEERVGADD